jgi:hypothetical protein
MSIINSKHLDYKPPQLVLKASSHLFCHTSVSLWLLSSPAKEDWENIWLSYTIHMLAKCFIRIH